jgi:ubiquinone/menaquinone biosynthesis C-methylase UbiE
MKIRWNSLENEWRKQLLSYAKGNVLEVEVGEGNNFNYYPMGVNVTATDLSAKMIEKARTKAAIRGVKAKFIVSPVENLKLEEQSFDTIISTFSLSAYENPGLVLEQFSKWCKPDGKILLLEYGLSRYGWVNWLQQKWEPFHYKRMGTHINRDILSIISGSKLMAKRVEVKYAGIVYLVWASLSPRVEIVEKNSSC